MPLRANDDIFYQQETYFSESILPVLVEQKLPLYNFQSYGAGAWVMYRADVQLSTLSIESRPAICRLAWGAIN